MFGYSIGAYLSSRLVLGVGLMTEIEILGGFPHGLFIGAVCVGALTLAQVVPAAFGTNSLVDAVASPTLDQLLAYVFVLATVVATASLLARMAARRREQEELLRIQEANLDSLAELNFNLQGYARTVDEESSERERNRISREIHDISGYIFTNLIALMDAAGSMPRDDHTGLTDVLITARKTAQEGLRETRLALRRLRSEQPRTTNTPRAIYKIVSIFRKITGLEVMLSLGGDLRLHLPVELVPLAAHDHPRRREEDAADCHVLDDERLHHRVRRAHDHRVRVDTPRARDVPHDAEAVRGRPPGIGEVA